MYVSRINQKEACSVDNITTPEISRIFKPDVVMTQIKINYDKNSFKDVPSSLAEIINENNANKSHIPYVSSNHKDLDKILFRNIPRNPQPMPQYGKFYTPEYFDISVLDALRSSDSLDDCINNLLIHLSLMECYKPSLSEKTETDELDKALFNILCLDKLSSDSQLCASLNTINRCSALSFKQKCRLDIILFIRKSFDRENPLYKNIYNKLLNPFESEHKDYLEQLVSITLEYNRVISPDAVHTSYDFDALAHIFHFYKKQAEGWGLICEPNSKSELGFFMKQYGHTILEASQYYAGYIYLNKLLDEYPQYKQTLSDYKLDEGSSHRYMGR